MSVSYNPDYTPTDIEGGVDTNSLPWTPLELAIGMSIKLLQASLEPVSYTHLTLPTNREV